MDYVKLATFTLKVVPDKDLKKILKYKSDLRLAKASFALARKAIVENMGRLLVVERVLGAAK